MIGLFKSHYSLGKSILTLAKQGDSDVNEPDSIFDICKEHSLKDLYLVEDSFAGFLEAYENAQAAKVNLRFGIRLTMTDDMNKKDEDSLASDHKVVIFMKNSAAYKALTTIYTKAATDGFYYFPRLDFKSLKSLWKEDLTLAIPFYDSFIHKNLLTFANCIPDLTFTNPIIFIENNLLPFDSLIAKGIHTFDSSNKYEKIPAKSIFYKNRKDFKAYLTFRCIHNRSQLEAPKLDHMSSAEFCVESWRDAEDKTESYSV